MAVLFGYKEDSTMSGWYYMYPCQASHTVYDAYDYSFYIVDTC